jgi:hypothetical protein
VLERELTILDQYRAHIMDQHHHHCNGSQLQNRPASYSLQLHQGLPRQQQLGQDHGLSITQQIMGAYSTEQQGATYSSLNINNSLWELSCGGPRVASIDSNRWKIETVNRLPSCMCYLWKTFLWSVVSLSSRVENAAAWVRSMINGYGLVSRTKTKLPPSGMGRTYPWDVRATTLWNMRVCVCCMNMRMPT